MASVITSPPNTSWWHHKHSSLHGCLVSWGLGSVLHCPSPTAPWIGNGREASEAGTPPGKGGRRSRDGLPRALHLPTTFSPIPFFLLKEIFHHLWKRLRKTTTPGVETKKARQLAFGGGGGWVRGATAEWVRRVGKEGDRNKAIPALCKTLFLPLNVLLKVLLTRYATCVCYNAKMLFTLEAT